MTQHDKHYVSLSPGERFSLLLEAMSRRDEPEADRVIYSCPRRSYSGPDAAFGRRVTLGLELITFVCGDLRHRLGALRVLLWAMASVEQCSTLHHIDASMAFVEGVRCGQGLSQSPFFNTGSRAAADDEERLEDVRLPQDCGLRLDAVEEQARQASLSIRKLLLRAGIDIAGELICLWEAFGQFARSRLGLAPKRRWRRWRFRRRRT
jgi:hypothetical protein